MSLQKESVIFRHSWIFFIVQYHKKIPQEVLTARGEYKWSEEVPDGNKPYFFPTIFFLKIGRHIRMQLNSPRST